MIALSPVKLNDLSPKRPNERCEGLIALTEKGPIMAQDLNETEPDLLGLQKGTPSPNVPNTTAFSSSREDDLVEDILVTIGWT